MIVDDFLCQIVERAPRQKKSLDKLKEMYMDSDRGGGGYNQELEELLLFFMDEYKCGTEYLADCYIFLNNTILEEQYFFVQNGYKYRYDKFEQINASVYSNDSFMKKYMCGLELSSYLWMNHFQVLRFFDQNISYVSSGHYLEIGVGFGLYLDRISRSHNKITDYVVCDVSETSIEKCKRMLEYRRKELPITFICQDVLALAYEGKFDSIIMGEVLEHVENPALLLGKLWMMLSDNGYMYITTAINAPTVDHIFLFENKDQVIELIENAGFEIITYICAPANGIDMVRAEKKKLSISMAAFIRKRKAL